MLFLMCGFRWKVFRNFGRAFYLFCEIKDAIIKEIHRTNETRISYVQKIVKWRVKTL